VMVVYCERSQGRAIQESESLGESLSLTRGVVTRTTMCACLDSSAIASLDIASSTLLPSRCLDAPASSTCAQHLGTLTILENR
jgi:hypothetical protein